MEDIEERIRKVIDEAVGNDLSKASDEINKNESLYSLGLDSLNIVILVVGLEEEFDIEFNDEEISGSNWKSITTIYDLIKEKGV